MKRIRVSDLRAMAVLKKPGYLEACHALGRPACHGTRLLFTDEDYDLLGQQYATPAAPAAQRPPLAVKTVGLGDIVGAIATPIARKLKLNCIDPATGQLKPQSKCEKRKKKLNQIQLPSSLRRLPTA